MPPALKHALEGAVTLAAGLALRLFAHDVEIPVISPAKTGVVLACVGGAQLLYAAYLSLTGSRHAKN
ncbi:DUF5708 family protein [Streptomyces sp. NPDC005336]|uniref:DUF5708 family protein n=1 Tax=unclassified Streptomyces TaxID=2593676 RepID=UPI0033A6CC00